MKQPSAPLEMAPSEPPFVSSRLYPDLSMYPPATTAAADTPDQSYRLNQISLIKKQLEEERDKRSALYKKYHRGVNVADGVDTALLTASMGMGIGGVGLFTTVIAAPVVLSLEVAALACGLLSVSGKCVSRRLSVNAKKLDSIRMVAETKLSTIYDYVSTALIDGEISDHKFQLILTEVEKYRKMKEDIRIATVAYQGDGRPMGEKHVGAPFVGAKRQPEALV